MTDARTASLAWVSRALTAELRERGPHVKLRAENLVAVAEEFSVPVEALVAWVHCRALGKRWSAEEFRRWCQRFEEVKGAANA
jgi:hypothetical protein